MKVITYMCKQCFEPHIFNENVESDFLCPKCGKKMMYFGTEEIDAETKKVINRYEEQDRKDKNSSDTIIPSSTPIIKCTYCGSPNTKKITVGSKAVHTALFGIFSIGRNSKEWHCNNCNSDF